MLLKLLLDRDFNSHREGTDMDVIQGMAARPEGSGGFSVVLAEKVLAVARSLRLPQAWATLTLGSVSRRSTAYTPPQRISALLVGLACGLRGIAPGNTLLRTNTALQQATGGQFPDQGTIHRWLAQVTDAQAAACREHLHQVVRAQGRFWDLLRAGRRLFVDCDGQGLVARDPRFGGACRGYLGGVFDRGYQRFVAYVGETHEVLDEFLRPANTMLIGELRELVAGLNTVFVPEWRDRVVIRTDAHGGTLNNLKTLNTAGYSYLGRLFSRQAIGRLRQAAECRSGCAVAVLDSRNMLHHAQCWDFPEWTIRDRQGRAFSTRAVVIHETENGRDWWMVLVTNLTDLQPAELWSSYHQRGGTIEEYNDQSERGFHLQVIRTGCLAGLNALHALVGLCWNLTVWSLATLELPPPLAPHADREQWVSALRIDRSDLLRRAGLSGLRLFRPPGCSGLEVEDTVHNPESATWLRWLGGDIQNRLHLTA
jgi:hypothetical protein